MKINLTVPQLKVISALSSNLAIVWLAALLTTKEPSALLFNFVFAIFSVYVATKAEEAVYYD